MYVGIRECYGKENEERIGGLSLMGCILDRLIRCIRCASSVRRPSAQSAPPCFINAPHLITPFHFSPLGALTS